MAVIIGFGTTISTSLFPDGGIVSINFGLNADVNRLWELGSFAPYDTLSTEHRVMSISAYGKDSSDQGGSNPVTLTPSTSCADTGTISITVTPAFCGDAIAPFQDDFYVTGYSYSKDEVHGYGTESWTLRSRTIMPDYTGNIVMLRGISTGQIMTGQGVLEPYQMGVVIDESASKNALGQWIEAESGSVTAGFPGIGNYDITREVVFTQVGGSYSKADGYRGNVNVTIPVEEVLF